VPRVLHRAGVLEAFITDFWKPSPQVMGLLPGSLRRKLESRQHPDLALAPVKALTLGAGLFDFRERVIRKHAGWRSILRRNEWFQRAIVRQLEGLKDGPERVLHSYSYCARLPFQWAKQRGWKTVLQQMDAGPEHERVLAELRARLKITDPDPPPPEAYWDAWRDETALADTIVVNSGWSADALVAAGVETRKLRVVPLAFQGVGTQPAPRKYPTEFTQERPFRLLFAGKLSYGKGVHELLDAMRLMESAPVELTVAGPVQASTPLALGTLKSVHFVGEKTALEMPALYASADAFVFPTHSDGFGAVQLEAQWSRLPVIASKHCGSVVKDGHNGLLLERVSAEEISKAVQICLDDPSALNRWSEASQIDPTNTLEAMGASLLELGRTC
jgi:glycosyltransferase involved in cell wall biosynthesis